ncbi:MAG TPA: PilZ domain-containing protein [Thermodesulfovibrionia bacterium]|nr:PilZ domain-containing protein [Thermodesulfovibrionia bacterium]
MEIQNIDQFYLRRLPRVSLTLPIQSHHEVGLHEATIENFTPEGFFIYTRHPVPGDVLSFTFKIPGLSRELKVKAEAMWHKMEENSASLGVKIIEISEDDRNELQKYYLSQLPDDIAVLIAPLLDSERIQEIFPVSDFELAYNFLSKLFEEQGNVMIISEYLDWIAEVSHKEITEDSIVFFLLKRRLLRTNILDNKHIRVCAGTMEDNLFYFHSVVQSMNEDTITIKLPDQIFSVRNRRRHFRAIQDPTWKMEVEIPLPYPSGTVIRREIVDLSGSGLSFKFSPMKHTSCLAPRLVT